MMDDTWRTRLDAAVQAHGGEPTARYAQLATVRADGRPANRTVVVRGLIEPEGCPVITTDIRSQKVSQLRENPWAELCWLFPLTREQFRFQGRVRVVTGPREAPLRDPWWQSLPEASRRTFLFPTPGTSPRAARADFPLEDPAPAEPPESFVLLVFQPEEVEYLDVRVQPHERVRYTRAGEGWSAEPINP
ncbi:MAG: pyridoxamine 5'-phosphate oxidase family protein [Isosphaeraceae bacterium]